MNKDLISMGYRQISKNIYLKPFGYTMMAYNFDKNEWSSHIMDINSIKQCWARFTYLNDSEFINFLKDCEYLGYPNKKLNSEFEFLTLKDQMEIQL